MHLESLEVAGFCTTNHGPVIVASWRCLGARLELARDPTPTVAWQRLLRRESSVLGAMNLLEEARRRGVAHVLQGHDDLVTSVAFSPDGKVRLWAADALAASRRLRSATPRRGPKKTCQLPAARPSTPCQPT